MRMQLKLNIQQYINSLKNMKVQVAKCNCGKARMMAATETTFDRKTTREFAKLMENGFEIITTSLEDARTMGMCFDGLHKNI